MKKMQGLLWGIVLLSFYFVVFILPLIGLVMGIVGVKNKIDRKKGKTTNIVKANRYCLYGIASVLFILCIVFFPIHTLFSAKYAKQDSLLQFFEKHYEQFEEKSFEENHNLSFGNDVQTCILGKKRTHGKPYNSHIVFELEYRTGTFFQAYPNTNFKNIIVYSENDLVAHNPAPLLYKEIRTTSHENWYFVYVADDYDYF